MYSLSFLHYKTCQSNSGFADLGYIEVSTVYHVFINLCFLTPSSKCQKIVIDYLRSITAHRDRLTIFLEKVNCMNSLAVAQHCSFSATCKFHSTWSSQSFKEIGDWCQMFGENCIRFGLSPSLNSGSISSSTEEGLSPNCMDFSPNISHFDFPITY